MTFESDFHKVVENTLTRIAWKLLGDEIGLHRRKQLIREPARATTAELLVFERLTQIPAKVLIDVHGLGSDVLTQSEIAMHAQRNQHSLILPPYETSTHASTAGTANEIIGRDRRSRQTATVATS